MPRKKYKQNIIKREKGEEEVDDQDTRAFTGLEDRVDRVSLSIADEHMDLWVMDDTLFPYDRVPDLPIEYPIAPDISTRCAYSFSDHSKRLYLTTFMFYRCLFQI